MTYVVKKHGDYRLSMISENGNTSSSALTGNMAIRDIVAQAKRDPKIRYGYLVEVLDDGETRVVDEWYGPPADGAVVNNLAGYQAAAYAGSPSWSLRLPVRGRDRGPDWGVPTEQVPMIAMAAMLYFLRVHGEECYDAGLAAGRQGLQADLRDILGIRTGEPK